MKKILITRRIPSIAKELLGKHFDVDENLDSEIQLKLAVKKYDGILSTISDKFTKDILTDCKIQVISNYAVGLDNIDVTFANSHHISVYNTPDVVTHSAADLTIALLLAVVRKIPSAQNFVKAGKWIGWDPDVFVGEELLGKTYGILGFGRIGQSVAKRLFGFGLNVIYYDPFVKNVDPALAENVRQVDFDELLQNSDYISLHTNLTDSTRKIINSTTIKKMYKKPIIINMSRGEIVDTDALLFALKDGSVRGAALDVTQPEPIPYDHPLCTLENCIITPHIGTATKECRYKMAELAAKNIINHFEKK